MDATSTVMADSYDDNVLCNGEDSSSETANDAASNIDDIADKYTDNNTTEVSHVCYAKASCRPQYDKPINDCPDRELCEYRQREHEQFKRVLAEADKLFEMLKLRKQDGPHRRDAFLVFDQAAHLVRRIETKRYEVTEEIQDEQGPCTHKDQKDCDCMCLDCGMEIRSCLCHPSDSRCDEEEFEEFRMEESRDEEDKSDRIFDDHEEMCSECGTPQTTCQHSVCDHCEAYIYEKRYDNHHKCFCEPCPNCNKYPPKCRFYSWNNEVVEPQEWYDSPDSVLLRIATIDPNKANDGRVIHIGTSGVSRIFVVPTAEAFWAILRAKASKTKEDIRDFFTLRNLVDLFTHAGKALLRPIAHAASSIYRVMSFAPLREKRARARAARERQAAIRDMLRETGEEHHLGNCVHVWDLEHVVQMVDELHESELLGVDSEGYNLGREGVTAYLQITDATRNVTYIVDLCALGHSAFDLKGKHGQTLRQILQDKTKRKLFWDVRQDSDALYAEFGIRLRGVVDLQIMNWIIDDYFYNKYRTGLLKWVRSYGVSGLGMEATERDTWCKQKEFPFGKNYVRFLDRPVHQALKDYMVGDADILPRIYAYLRIHITDEEMASVLLLTERQIGETQLSDYPLWRTLGEFDRWYRDEWYRIRPGRNYEEERDWYEQWY